MLTDDLPWPELGNVSRGATRGNQGQKGVLGPPDSEGRCLLQLRVQPGVLAVRLNRQSSDWYHILDSEVTRALKLTKTYWRKARRRQDYDARADQDHMELHEWLQQLKDKVMAHLELLMQKGEIQGPPYIMPEHLELTFLRKFIERQAAGIPHNPRLRRAYLHTSSGAADQQTFQPQNPVAPTSSVSLAGWNSIDQNDDRDREYNVETPPGSVSTENARNIMHEMESSRTCGVSAQTHCHDPSPPKSGILLQNARTELARARRTAQEAFSRYTACLDAEEKARQQVLVAEHRRDTLTSTLIDLYQNELTDDAPSSRNSPGTYAHNTAAMHGMQSGETANEPHTETMSPMPNNTILPEGVSNSWRNWSQTGADSSSLNLAHHTIAMSSQGDGMQADGLGSDRKHPRTWEDVRAREGFDDLRPIKRHQFSSSIPNVMSSPALSSLRQPTVTLATTDPPRIDQSSGVLMSAQSASHLSGCNMTI